MIINHIHSNVLLFIFFLVFPFVIRWVQQVNRLEINPDKRFLAAAGNPHIRLFDVNSNSAQPVYLHSAIIFFLKHDIFFFVSDINFSILHGRSGVMIHIQIMSWQWDFNVMETGCIQDLRMAQ